MPTKRILDFDNPSRVPLGKVCHDSDHYPSRMRVFEPGLYEHVCPTCKKKTYFVIRKTEFL